jgi:uncharacterized protein (DUF2062 family)
LTLHRLPPPPGFEASWEWLSANLADAWLPLVVGSLMVSVVASASTYWAVRFFWKWNVGRQWRRRRARRLEAA